MTPTVQFLLAIEAVAASEIVARRGHRAEYAKIVLGTSLSLSLRDWWDWQGRSVLAVPTWQLIIAAEASLPEIP